MESEAAAARDALDAVAETRALNAERLRRSPRYWPMCGVLLAVYGLLPYTRGWPPLLWFLVPPALSVVVVSVAAWRQPTAVRKIKLTGTMWLPFLGFVLAGAALEALDIALYVTHGWWWVPPSAAVLLFVLVVVAGPVIDRSWARRVGGVGH